MSITGYYDGSVIQIKESLKPNQRVIIIPIDDDASVSLPPIRIRITLLPEVLLPEH